jgi:hypothetical protein
MYDEIIGPTPIGGEEKPSSYADRALRARKNAGLDTDDQARGVDEKQDEVIVIDDDDDDVVPGVFIKDDPNDHLSISGKDDLPGKEMIDSPDKGETLGRGKRKIIPRTLFPPKMKGKTHGDKATTGVGFPQIKKIVVEREKDEILNQYAGAGYGTKRGVINLVFDENAPPPTELSPKETDSHILGVILANQYNLKKGKELFGDRCDKAVMAELSEIDGLETHEPQKIEDLSYKDKKRALGSLILISEKRADQDGHSKIKGRCVAVGRVNPYDPCVANKIVNGAQCTVCWHVDNLKVSHVDEAVVAAFLLKLADLYKGRVKTHRGRVFDYLGMDLDYGSSPHC